MTVFNHKKLELTAKPVPGGAFPPNLKADFYNGNPQLFVLTGMSKGEGATYIRAGIEIKTADMLCELIIAYADQSITNFVNKRNEPEQQPETGVIKIECKSGKEKELVSEIVVGKTKEGKMFISVVDKKNDKAPIIQFMFGTDLYHPITAKNVDMFTPAYLSCVAAKAWATRVRSLWNMTLYDNPPPEKNNGGNKGGYNNNNGYNKGGHSGHSAPSSDDAPW